MCLRQGAGLLALRIAEQPPGSRGESVERRPPEKHEGYSLQRGSFFPKEPGDGAESYIGRSGWRIAVNAGTDRRQRQRSRATLGGQLQAAPVAGLN